MFKILIVFLSLIFLRNVSCEENTWTHINGPMCGLNVWKFPPESLKDRKEALDKYTKWCYKRLLKIKNIIKNGRKYGWDGRKMCEGRYNYAHLKEEQDACVGVGKKVHVFNGIKEGIVEGTIPNYDRPLYATDGEKIFSIHAFTVTENLPFQVIFIIIYILLFFSKNFKISSQNLL